MNLTYTPYNLGLSSDFTTELLGVCMPYQVLQPYAHLHANCSITFLCAFMVTNHSNSTAAALAGHWTWRISSFHLHALRPIETKQELIFSLVTPFVNMSVGFLLV